MKLAMALQEDEEEDGDGEEDGEEEGMIRVWGS